MRRRLHIPRREDKSKETGCGLGVNSSEPGLTVGHGAGEDGGRAVRINGSGACLVSQSTVLLSLDRAHERMQKTSEDL